MIGGIEFGICVMEEEEEGVDGEATLHQPATTTTQ